MKQKKLSAVDKDFYGRVRLAIFTNPFSDQRAEVDRAITGARPGWSTEKIIRQLIAVVSEHLEATFGGARSLRRFAGEDRTLVQYGVLFHLFHLYCDRFDDHIQAQIEHGDTPCKVAFWQEIIDAMLAHGLERKEAVRYFSLFFQMRRAYYFIDRIIGSSPCMRALRLNLWNNIFTHDIGLYERHLWNRLEDFSTMLLGATGTGKGLAAAAIGRSGYIPFDEKSGCFAESFTRAFTPLNLSQFPEQLLESELFGHRKGSFTGAVDNYDGVFTRCSPFGAIFLDEIGEVSVPVQIKLLQVLQDRVFTPVGSHRRQRFQGRVIAATNRSIDKLRQQGAFRNDFYYRLCSDIIEVPSLARRIRENPRELDDLLAHTANRIVGKSSPELVVGICESLKKSVPADYAWPGNVRELEQCVRRILLKNRYEGDIDLSQEAAQDSLAEGMARGEYTAQQLLSRYCKLLYARLGTYEAVARQAGLDRRTVKRYIEQGPERKV